MEKLLVTSNFSFSYSVFKRLALQTRKNQGLFGKRLRKPSNQSAQQGRSVFSISDLWRDVCGFYANWGILSFLQFFSSPEHKVLMVSYCDCPMSGLHNFFKHLLLLNHLANLDETWQGCSLGEAPPKLFKRLNSTHNSGCHGNQKEKYSKIFENLLLWN